MRMTQRGSKPDFCSVDMIPSCTCVRFQNKNIFLNINVVVIACRGRFLNFAKLTKWRNFKLKNAIFSTNFVTFFVIKKTKPKIEKSPRQAINNSITNIFVEVASKNIENSMRNRANSDGKQRFEKNAFKGLT
jgi:hypothetical protein